MIPYGRQDITQEDLASVVEVLQSDWLTQGPMVPQFEQSVMDKTGAKFAVAVNSATSALHLACLALGLGPNDWLWTSPNTFVASANCARYCGANVDFVDIDPATYNLSVDSLAQKLMQAEKLGKLPKIVVPVHFAGQSCNMKEIYALSQQYGFHIIEDASHAIGGKYNEKFIGNCEYSDITIFSFHPVKIITTCEGGMAVTNKANLFDDMQRLRSHGITRDAQKMQGVSQGPWYYEQLDLGFNYRMTDLQAALGVSQMSRLDKYIQRRQQIAAVYNQQLADLPLILPFQQAHFSSAFHLYVVQVDPEQTKVNRENLFDSLREAQIGVNVHYIPVHTQPYYKNLGFKVGDFPQAEHYYNHAISIPMYATLTDQEQSHVINALRKNIQ